MLRFFVHIPCPPSCMLLLSDDSSFRAGTHPKTHPPLMKTCTSSTFSERLISAVIRIWGLTVGFASNLSQAGPDQPHHYR